MVLNGIERKGGAAFANRAYYYGSRSPRSLIAHLLLFEGSIRNGTYPFSDTNVLFGVLLVYPTMVLQNSLIEEFGNGTFILPFFLSGGIEEFLKWLFLYHLIFRHEAFDEPYDGIVYAVAVSLGYATLENIIYAFLMLHLSLR